MTARVSFLDYYFVPLGREPGGLLELLDLPPTASDGQVANRVAQLLRALDEEYQAKRRQPKAHLDYSNLKARLDEGEITQTEFDAECETLVSRLLGEEIVAKRRYEELRAEYEAGGLTEAKYQYRLRVILQPIGRKELVAQRDSGQITREEFEDRRAALVAKLEAMELTPEEVEAQRAAVLEELETSEITKEEFDKLDKEWNEERTAEKTRLNALKEPYKAMLATKRDCEDKGHVFDTTVWRDLYDSQETPAPDPAWLAEAVDLADTMWDSLGGSHRSSWRKKVREWSQEVGRLGPSLDASRVGVGTRRQSVEPEFPSLCEPYPLAIERLEREEVEEIALQPVRRDQRRVVLDQLMKALLSDLAEEAPREEAAPTTARRPSIAERRARTEAQREAEEFMRFLQALARLRGDK
jgi:hypothetical protein